MSYPYCQSLDFHLAGVVGQRLGLLGSGCIVVDGMESPEEGRVGLGWRSLWSLAVLDLWAGVQVSDHLP